MRENRCSESYILLNGVTGTLLVFSKFFMQFLKNSVQKRIREKLLNDTEFRENRRNEAILHLWEEMNLYGTLQCIARFWQSLAKEIFKLCCSACMSFVNLSAWKAILFL